MTTKTLSLVFLLMMTFCRADAFDIRAVKEFQDREIETMRIEFERIVGASIPFSDEYVMSVSIGIDKMIRNGASADFLSESQFFVYVDRNPKKQLIFVCFLDSIDKKVEIIGIDKISTGNPERKGFFITPVGFFRNTVENFNYRALGTKNEKGWRGLGAKGSRVWDFGWQKTVTKNEEERYIRLLMHATDPDFGELRLGRVDSQGCVRVSARMNKFLDYFGILDKEYEKVSGLKKVAHLLQKDRKSVSFAGKYLIVGDSGM